jgi:hypothetical protein
MQNDNNKPSINYDSLTIEAMRNLVKSVLNDVSKNGLPNKHHFYITFITNYENVEIPKDIKSNYPDEMTIVIENSFWDLLVQENNFSLKLSFDGIKKILIIPFNSLIAFSDPYANFHLKFPKLDYNETEKLNSKSMGKINIVNIKDFKKDK